MTHVKSLKTGAFSEEKKKKQYQKGFGKSIIIRFPLKKSCSQPTLTVI